MDALSVTVSQPLESAEAAIRQALAAEGFGVLTEIDVAATLKAKLGVERAPLKILGACNPTFAHRALEVDPSVSLLLPCNVVLETTTGGTRISTVDPRQLLVDDRLAPLADDAAVHLRRALDAVAADVRGGVA
jgi:uncharacterized protein (DUF302 family)